MSIQTFISVDTETGGLLPRLNPLLSVGIGVYALDPVTLNYTTVSENEWRLRPSQFPDTTVDSIAIQTNHLDIETLERDGYLAGDVAENICNVLDQAKRSGGRFHVLGQNYVFDRGFLRRYIPEPAFHRLDLNLQVDLMTVYQAYLALVTPDWSQMPSKSLAHICKRLGVQNENAHAALADAKATFQCYVAIQKNLRKAGRIVQHAKESSVMFNELNLLTSELV